MKAFNVAELEGAALDWAVSDALDWMTEGDAIEHIEDPDMIIVHHTEDWDYEVETTQFSPSTDWSQGGPLLQSYRVNITYSPGSDDDSEPFVCSIRGGIHCGSTPLIAACRAIVAVKFGDTVEVPEELL